MDRIEVRDLIISWFSISLAFAIIYARFDQIQLFDAFLISAIAVGTGFILHELAHKYVAIHYGAKAAFRMWPLGLVLAVGLAIVAGFIFAAPGAVYVMGNVSARKNGIISLAGPITNIILAGIFFVLAAVSTQPFWAQAFGVAFSINLWLALFNMIPIFPLDGSKVFKWNPIIWAIVFIPLVLIVFPRFF